MRKYILIFATLLITYSLSAQPKFEFAGTSQKDWGKVLQDSGPLKTKIKIKNTGNKTLEIYGIKPGCGCTTAPIDKKLIDPGDFATVSVELKIIKDSGPITKGIEFTTNDPKNDRVNYYLKANVKVPLEVFPEFMNMGAILLNESKSGRVVLTNHTNKKITIKAVKVSNKDITTDIKAGKVLEPNSYNPVGATIKSNTEGLINGEITFLTDSKKYPEVTIKVRGIVGKKQD